MKEDRTDVSPMDQAVGAVYQAVQAQRAVSQAVQMQRAAWGTGAAQKAAHSFQAAYAVTAAAQGGGTAAGAAAGTALGGPLGTVVGTLATSKTFRKVIAGIFAALFLWMFLIANMIGIILTYLGFADADAFANEAQSAELSNIKARIEAILKKEEYKQEILALLEGARDKGLQEIEADKGAKYPDHGLTVVDEYESRLKTNTSYYLATLLSEVWDTSGINSFFGYPSDWGDMSTDLTSKYDAYFKEAAEVYGVPVALLKAMGMAESGFNQNAVSGAGAIGVMQLMPGTATSLGVNPHNARENIMGGAKYIAKNLEQFKNHSNGLELAIAAYNEGPGNVIKYGYQIPPFKETQNYVKRVLGYITIQERRAGSTEDPDEDLSDPYSQLKKAVSENADRIFSWSVTGEGEIDTTKTVYYQLQKSGKTEIGKAAYEKLKAEGKQVAEERVLAKAKSVEYTLALILSS